MVKINVGALLSKSQGSAINHSINEKLNFSDDVVFLAPFTAEVTLMRLPHEINVQLKDGRTKTELNCEKCLRDFGFDVHIPFVEREFLVNLPEGDVIEGEEVFYLEKGSNHIDLSDMIRQEVLLHFDPFPVCSQGCKGLCDRCGANLNEGVCPCPSKQDYTNPFSELSL